MTAQNLFSSFKKLSFFGVAFCICTLSACDRNLQSSDNDVEGYAPVYATNQELAVSVQQPRPVSDAGKIVLYKNMLFQVENDKGIHVFDVQNPAKPVQVAFVQSALCKELAIKDDHLITNNMADMIVLDFSNRSDIKLVKRLGNMFPEMSLQYPPQTGVYFECADPKKGLVVKWEKKMLHNPACKR